MTGLEALNWYLIGSLLALIISVALVTLDNGGELPWQELPWVLGFTVASWIFILLAIVSVCQVYFTTYFEKEAYAASKDSRGIRIIPKRWCK